MPPNTLHAVMVTAAIASGRVSRIEPKAALALPGVIAVLTPRGPAETAAGAGPARVAVDRSDAERGNLL